MRVLDESTRLDDKEKDLEAKANKAAIRANLIAWLSLAVSVFAFVVAVKAYLLDLKPYMGAFRDEINKNNTETNELLGEISKKMGLPLTLAFGVHNGADAFVGSVDAEPGQEIPAEMIFYNISGTILDISAHVSLPETLEFVPGSAKLFDSSYPDGKDIEADLSAGWESLGSYNLYNAETGHGSGVVLFKVKVSENKNLFKQGVGALNMAAEIGGYMGGSAVTDTIYCYASVLVSQ